MQLLDLEEAEQQQEAHVEMAAEKAKRVALHRAACMNGMDELFDDLMVKGDGDMAKLRTQPQFHEPLHNLREQVDAASEEYIATVLSHKASKTSEHQEFLQALNHAKARASGESKEEIAAYNALAKRNLTEPTLPGIQCATECTTHCLADLPGHGLMYAAMSARKREVVMPHAPFLPTVLQNTAQSERCALREVDGPRGDCIIYGADLHCFVLHETFTSSCIVGRLIRAIC